MDWYRQQQPLQEAPQENTKPPPSHFNRILQPNILKHPFRPARAGTDGGLGRTRATK